MEARDDKKNMENLLALHRYWLTADAVRLTVYFSIVRPDNMEDELFQYAQMQSSTFRFSVWYALLYVVVEGYRELSIFDGEVDELLRNEQMADYLRCFRNAIFHFQGKLFGQKLMNFLEQENSEVWIQRLHSAFDAFFEKEIIEKALGDRRSRNGLIDDNIKGLSEHMC